MSCPETLVPSSDLNPPRSFLRRIFRLLAGLALLGFFGLALLFLALWVERRSDITLPIPTGPFAVGRSTDVWADDTPDPLAPTPGTKRELAVWIWYPSAHEQSGA